MLQLDDSIMQDARPVAGFCRPSLKIYVFSHYPQDSRMKNSPPSHQQEHVSIQNLRHIDLNLLIVLATLLETNSVSQTAKRLGSTQPSVSRMLDRLRKDLADPLLIKSAAKMILTRRAKDLAPLVSELLTYIGRIYSSYGDYSPRNETGTYVIGMNDSLQTIFLPLLFQRLQLISPRAQVRAQPVPQPGGLVAMMSGNLDLMVAFYPIESESLRSELLFNTSFGCLCSINNTQVGYNPTARTLSSLPCVDISQFGIVTKLVEKFFQENGCERKVVGTLTSYLAASDVVSQGNMYAMVPQYLSETLCRGRPLRYIAMNSPALTIPVNLCWHNNVHNHRFVGILRSMLTTIAQDFSSK